VGVAIVPTAALVAACAIVVAGLQNFTQPTLRWVIVVAMVFGLLNGCSFGDVFSSAHSFAGAHPIAALTAFAALVVVAQLWLGAVMVATGRWIEGFGAAGRVVALVIAVLIVHDALHLVVERA